MKLIKPVVSYLIAGSLGVGKTSLIKQLLAQKPTDERWAVLVNEFGQIGLDKALLGADGDDVSITEIAGGCVCCTGGAPFQIALTKLLQTVQPDILLIELSGLGHPLPLLKQLTMPPWSYLLDLRPMIYVQEAKQLVEQDKNIRLAKEIGLLVANKAELVTKQQQMSINKLFAPLPIYWTNQGYCPLSLLPKNSLEKKTIVLQTDVIASDSQAITKQNLITGIEYAIQEQAEGWSIGWCFDKAYIFDKQRLIGWLAESSWIRAKLVVQTPQGWLSVNAIDKSSLQWKISDWRKDSRIELIFIKQQVIEELIEGLLRTLVKN